MCPLAAPLYSPPGVEPILEALAEARQLAARHPLAAYLATVFAFSWSDWVTLAATGGRVAPGSMPTHFAGFLGPAFAAFAVTAMAEGRRGLAAFSLRLLRVPWRTPSFWALGLSPLAFLATGIALLAATGRRLPTLASLVRFPGLPAMPVSPVFDIVLLTMGFGHEIGWRGFALPRFQARFGPLGGALALAVPWGLWLAPLLTVNEAWSGLGWRSTAVLAASLVAGSIVLAFVVARTGGAVAAAALWHACYQMASATAGARGFLASLTSWAVIGWAVVLLAAERAARRRGRSLLVPAEAGGGADRRPEPH